MNKFQRRRLISICLLLSGIALAAGLILLALKKNINVFLTPSQLLSQHPNADYHIRLGGIVKKNSIKRNTKTLHIQFVITDFKNEIVTEYTGILPDLFREGKGIIAEGSVTPDGKFHATQVLAKHDENYLPKKSYVRLRNTLTDRETSS